MSLGNGQRMRAVASLVPAPHTPAPMAPMAVVAPDWDDYDEVDFHDDGQDDTVNVAAETLEATTATEKRSMVETRRPNTGKAVGHTTDEPAAALPMMIRVAGNGTVVANQGGAEELAGVVAYTHRLVDLVGDMLGLEGFIALECVFKAPPPTGGQTGWQHRCLLFTEPNGDTVLVRPRTDWDERALRESLGL
jgi:hypothetical protein